MPHAQCPLSHLLLMVMNGGQRNSVLYQRSKAACLSHGARETGLCHGGRLPPTSQLGKICPIVGEGQTLFTTVSRRQHS